MRVPDAIAKSVVYVGFTELDEDEGEERDHICGTAFVAEHDDRGRIFKYLFTADHVVRDIAGKKSWLRVNLKSGGTEKVSLRNTVWFTHPRENIDATACISSLGGRFDVEGVPTERFIINEANREERGVGIGDDCFTLGLFALVSGQHQNTPLLRYGTLAMIPRDPIRTRRYGSMQAFLAETRSLPGASGAPVFVRESLRLPMQVTRPGKTEANVYPTASGSFFLLGLTHGFWDSESLDEEEFPEYEGFEAHNLGLSIVVPAEKLIDIIAQPAVATLRDQAVTRRKRPRAPREATQRARR